MAAYREDEARSTESSRGHLTRRDEELARDIHVNYAISQELSSRAVAHVNHSYPDPRSVQGEYARDNDVRDLQDDIEKKFRTEVTRQHKESEEILKQKIGEEAWVKYALKNPKTTRPRRMRRGETARISALKQEIFDDAWGKYQQELRPPLYVEPVSTYEDLPAILPEDYLDQGDIDARDKDRIKDIDLAHIAAIKEDELRYTETSRGYLTHEQAARHKEDEVNDEIETELGRRVKAHIDKDVPPPKTTLEEATRLLAERELREDVVTKFKQETRRTDETQGNTSK